MRLTDYTDYGLRALIYAAIRPERLVTIQEIAEAFRIPHSHLMKIVHALGKAGFLVTVRGRKGGVRLGHAATDIKVGQVVRAMEPDFRMAQCFEGDQSECVIVTACQLRGTMQRALDAYLAVLDECSLADLAAQQDVLVALTTVSRLTGAESAGSESTGSATATQGDSNSMTVHPLHFMRPLGRPVFS